MISRQVVFLILGSIIKTNTAQPLSLSETYELFPGMVPNDKINSSGFHRDVYYYGQTIAVVDSHQSDEIHECNIAGGLNPDQIEGILDNWSKSVTIFWVSLPEMVDMLRLCGSADETESNREGPNTATHNPFMGTKPLAPVFLIKLVGIVPGTKWCGANSGAKYYHDLGVDRDIDRCCRAHDLCPVSISSGQTAFNITNKSMYTISHCACDQALYECLKSVGTPTASFIGIMYFNFAQVKCIDEYPDDVGRLHCCELSPTEKVY